MLQDSGLEKVDPVNRKSRSGVVAVFLEMRAGSDV